MSLLSINGLVFALDSDRSQPINITSDSFQHEGKSGKTVYLGDVNLHQGSFMLKANRLEVFTDEGGNLKEIKAFGTPATFEQQPKADKEKVKGQAKLITYDTIKNEINLIGNARVNQGRQLKMESEHIEYLADSEQVRANPNQSSSNTPEKEKSRVNIVIPPQVHKAKKQGAL
ncbi:MAG: lipopolysaccharide transport periplasmic protein LptA [Cellvibrionales bacterium]|nr:lipopolysaccharide transport periplasmic protein LptA [Cellvibrionales bacterium]